jgi:penicillin-binding protein 1A
LLEQYENQSTKVTSEYVALTMVDMMRGVTSGGGTAAGANAAGHPLAGKTGTVNDHTDVWFIGYTPTYVTGVWMGNPLRKESLGAGMTGGHGALPYFNAFMSQFMKGKPMDKFPPPPPMPPEVKREMEMRKREELEALQEADLAGRRYTGPSTGATTVDPNAPPAGVTPPSGTVTDPGTTKPPDTVPDKPIIVKPIEPKSTPRPDPLPAKPEGEKRKGKKGDG